MRTHLFVMMLLCVIHETGATKGMAEARVVTDTSAVTRAVSRPATGMPTNSENTGEARGSIANGLSEMDSQACAQACTRTSGEGGRRQVQRTVQLNSLAGLERELPSYPITQ